MLWAGFFLNNLYLNKEKYAAKRKEIKNRLFLIKIAGKVLFIAKWKYFMVLIKNIIFLFDWYLKFMFIWFTKIISVQHLHRCDAYTDPGCEVRDRQTEYSNMVKRVGAEKQDYHWNECGQSVVFTKCRIGILQVSEKG